MNTDKGGHIEPQAVNPERRANLMRLAALCGLAASGEVLAALAKPAATPGFLGAEALALTGVLADLIIPRTSTPGALAVGAHRTISHLLGVCATRETQARFLAGLARLDEAAVAEGAKRFAALKPARQVALLHALDETRAPFNGSDHQFFRLLKDYVALAYYTSEPGATRELNYLPVPGGFKGNVPLKKIGRAWAL